MHKKSFVIFRSRVLLGFMQTLLCVAWAADGATVAKTWGIAIPHSFAGSSGPRFDRGMIIVQGYDSPRISAWDSSGRVMLQTTLNLPSADQVSISDVAVNPRGGFWVAGSAQSWEGQAANFLVWLSPAGVTERVVRVSPFAPMRISVCSDGSVWAAGRELRPDQAGRMRYVPNHAILRRYDQEGRETHAVVSRETFAASVHPVQQRSRLACGADRVGFFSLPANEWVEVSLDGKLLGRWKGVTLDKDTQATGMNILPDGAVYATTVTRLPGDPSMRRATLFRLDRGTGSWNPIPLGDDILGFDRTRHYAEIIGTDTSDLVIHAALPNVAALRIH